MKVVIVIDSFKGSLSSIEVSNVVEAGILEVYKDAKIIKIPIADGGEGTVDALISSLGGNVVESEVYDPLWRRIKATYGILPDNTAVIEMASCAGLTLLNEEERNPLYTTTYGVGELILDAIPKGCRDFIIGIGGSATNDAGLGMLQALGYRFYDKDGEILKGIGESLNKLAYIDMENVDQEIFRCRFEVLCDVKNPLYGENGASFVFAPQKGADEKAVKTLDEGLRNFASVIKTSLGKDIANLEGAGAAGGLGGGLFAFLNAKLLPGIEIIFKKINIEEKLNECDIIITGEGKIDFQSVMGKVPFGVASLGKKYQIPVIGLCGSLMNDAYKMYDNGITSLFSIINHPMTLEDAMDKRKASELIKLNTISLFRLLKSFNIK